MPETRTLTEKNRLPIGVALAGGGPLGGIYEVGALLALDEALRGFRLTDCSIFVGVSSGAFFATGLANGLSPRAMHRMFIESDKDDDPFEPEVLLRPAFKEYGRRIAAIPRLLKAGRSRLSARRPQAKGRGLPARGLSKSCRPASSTAPRCRPICSAWLNRAAFRTISASSGPSSISSPPISTAPSA